MDFQFGGLPFMNAPRDTNILIIKFIFIINKMIPTNKTIVFTIQHYASRKKAVIY